MHRIEIRKGFTLVELLVGLMVTSIILSAVATLAFALSSASRASNDVVYTQTQVRFVTLRIVDLIRHGRMVCAQFGDTLVIWKTDYNQNNRIDINEVVYLEFDAADETLRLYEFSVPGNPCVLAVLGLPSGTAVLAELAKPATKQALIEECQAAGQVRETTILNGCRDLSFWLHESPPRTRRVTISFLLAEGGDERQYEIDAAMRVSAQHLLRGNPPELMSDDD